MVKFFSIIFIAFFLTSCSSQRHINKSRLVVDSAVVKKNSEFKKDTTSITLEEKHITHSTDTVVSKEDSLQGNFSYNTTDTGCIDLFAKSGSLDMQLHINPKTGKGNFKANKKSEKIPINTYKEDSKKLLITGANTTFTSNSDSASFHKELDNKVLDSSHNWAALKWFFIVLFLLILIAAYIYLRNVYTRGATITSILNIFKNGKSNKEKNST
jgi:hypothetical protein